MQKSKKTILVILVSLALGAGLFALWKFHYLPQKYNRLTQKILNGAFAALDDTALAGQPIHIAIPGTELTEQNRKIITELKPGGIIFFGFNLEDAAQIKKLTSDLQRLASELEIPPFLISTDQEGGYVRRVRDGVLQTPPAMNLGETGDSELCRATGYHVSHGLGQLGINVFFAPIVDINNNPNNPVIGLRSFGSTIKAVVDCALPFEEGARLAHLAGGSLPVIKHFPGHGDTHVDSHWALPVIDKTLQELRAFELVPFEKAIQAGAHAVMTAHILYPQVDKDAPATLSAKWLTTTLRGDLKFQGVVFTDAMEMSALSKHYSHIVRPVAAIKAGADVMLYTSWQEEPPEAKAKILEAIKSGDLPRISQGDGERSALERAVMNQLTAKLPYIDAGKYLTPEEAGWYRQYGEERLAKKKSARVLYDTEALQQKYAKIKWSPSKKKGGPIWLAGRKNKG